MFVQNDLNVYGRINIGRRDEVALKMTDSGGDNSIYHTVNDGQGNYNIMLGVDGTGTGSVSGDGTAKILMQGHGQDGAISMNAGLIDDASGPHKYVVGLSIQADDQKLRIGNPNSSVGLYNSNGNVIASASGELMTHKISARTSTGLSLQDDGTNVGVFIEDGGQVAVGHSTPKSTLHIAGSGDGQAFGGKELIVTEVYSNVLTIELADEEACYVKMTINGTSWANHGPVMFLGEYFITNGVSGSATWGEPGRVIRELNSTVSSEGGDIIDSVHTQLSSSANKVTIRAKIDDPDMNAAEGFAAKVNFHIMGEFDSIS